MATVVAMNPQTRDPLIRLPYEPWLRCLSFAALDSADGPLPYLAVSPNWSENILSSPTLWTQIITDHGGDEEARLHTFLHLSAGQPLEVVCPGNVPVQLLRLLAQHRTRIISLYINNAMASVTMPTRLWASLGHPKMQRLAFRSHKRVNPIAQALVPTCPNLRSLEGRSYIEESMIAATLEEASVSCHTLADLGALYKCTRLRSLTLMRDDTKQMSKYEMRNHFPQISSYLGPHLVDLEITLYLEEFIVFMPYIPSFVALYSAAFTVRMEDPEPPSQIASPIPKQGTSSLRMLSLTTYFPYIVPLKLSDPVRDILDYLSEHHILQDLHTFRYHPTVFIRESVSITWLLRCLSKARVLHIILGGAETDITSTYPPIYMPNLAELSLRSITWLTHIEAPNLVHLNCSLFDYSSVTPHLSEHFGSKISHLVVDITIWKAINKAYLNGVGPKFESLRTLQISEPLTIEWVVHLPSIRIIDFAYRSTSEPLNFLLLHLLRHPDALPNLLTLKSRTYPWWELLFEVLRRRNTAQMHRIQELRLPGFPILAILSRLVKLLQGNTDVYTNRDIDEVIYKRWKDEGLYV
jgi:hypothetical protein